MSVLDKISFFQNRRDEIPNKELAKMLAETENKEGIAEIAASLGHRNRNVQSDCLSVLYYIGYVKPELIADYVNDFLKLLEGKNNRLIWGSMIALSTIADRRPKEIYAKLDIVRAAIEKGTLITVVWGIKALAKMVTADKTYGQKIYPILAAQLRNCIPRDVAMHAESILPAVDEENKALFLSIIESRKKKLTASQLARLKKAIRVFKPDAKI